VFHHHPETAWGAPKTTKALIDAVKAAGFTTVRIPAAWSGYLDSSGTINSTWLTRVKEVVQYVTNNSMYAILNDHWDGGWLEENPRYS
jgi:endoglucanase